MSELCLMNLKKHRLNFEKLDSLANSLVALSLKNKIAVFFHTYDYAAELINSAGMKNFFLLSDSFLYKNCGFLDITSFVYETDIQSYRVRFLEKYHFLQEVIDKVFEYEVDILEIYISEDGSAEVETDFEVIETAQGDFVETLFQKIWKDSSGSGFFPTTKFIIHK